MASDGTKVTTDPATFNQPKNENPGVVTSDSLAAESIQGGGAFAANSASRGPMSQTSASTTTNVTDVSGATELAPAPNAAARQEDEPFNERAQLDAGRERGENTGRGPTWATPAGSGGVARVRDATNVPQPKGKNLTEGGFDSDAPNASFSTDMGGRKDPGRVALGRMEAADAAVPGGGAQQGRVTNDGQFDVLKETSA